MGSKKAKLLGGIKQITALEKITYALTHIDFAKKYKYAINNSYVDKAN